LPLPSTRDRTGSGSRSGFSLDPESRSRQILAVWIFSGSGFFLDFYPENPDPDQPGNQDPDQDPDFSLNPKYTP